MCDRNRNQTHTSHHLKRQHFTPSPVNRNQPLSELEPNNLKPSHPRPVIDAHISCFAPHIKRVDFLSSNMQRGHRRTICIYILPTHKEN